MSLEVSVRIKGIIAGWWESNLIRDRPGDNKK